MRDYAKVVPKMWHGQTIKSLRKRGPEGVIVSMYLMTSPMSNMLGLFTQPLMYMAYETGLGIEGASKGLQDCIEEGFCKYDNDTETVWVVEMASYQIASELKASDLRVKGIQKDFDALKGVPFADEFFKRYEKAFRLEKQTAQEAPSKTLPSQEQEQEQEKEQEQEQEKGETAPASHTPPPPTPKPEKPKREQTTLAVYLAACKASRAKPIPDDHHAKQWANDAGISTEMLQIAWVQFRDRYTTDEKAKGKRYKDWPGHFANAIKSNWFKLWFMGDDGRPAWTSTGLTHKAALDAKQRREAAHA